MYHYRKTRNRYASYPKKDTCDFCDLSKLEGIVEEHTYCYVIKNRIFYDLWEYRRVKDHLMVVPRRHVHSLNELKSDEMLETMQVMSRYESLGYNIYARTTGSVTRSIYHQHTHLIKASNKLARAALFVRKPYIFWKI